MYLRTLIEKPLSSSDSRNLVRHGSNKPICNLITLQNLHFDSRRTFIIRAPNKYSVTRDVVLHYVYSHRGSPTLRFITVFKSHHGSITLRANALILIC